ncbi:oxysterol binding protein [Thraustotheca clavata]|uniref:Oxysterol binding protein n=1 Tax=Thraustotheca clavata TaxID=74557 RepID=A0A1V9ZBZ1_9STRA|nr:oxysterol binding protein [Thraustotheca clavata]
MIQQCGLNYPPAAPSKLDGGVQDKHYWQRGFKLNKKGGVVFQDKEILKKQQGVVKDVMVQLGTQLLSGKLAVRLSLPIRVFEPRSLLERVAEAWSYAPTYLTKAATSTDPIERMKHLMCFVVSGLHCCVNQNKPFNPILGETYQAVLSDGTLICMEHIQHHPPVSAFYVDGPNGLYKLHGRYEFESNMSGNSITNYQNGITSFECANGVMLKYELPQLKMGGVMFGDRLVEWSGHARFNDAQNNLLGTLNFEGNDSFLGRSSGDDIKGTICSSKKESKSGLHIKVTGSWLSHLSFDGKVEWDLAHEPLYLPTPVDNAIPSDSRYRQDLIELKAGENEKAQASKLHLEEFQRNDKKLRGEKGKAHKRHSKKVG